MKELHTTGVPLSFECSYACEVDDCNQVEGSLHRAFAPYRKNPKREFFEIEPDQAIVILQLVAKKDVTPIVNAEIDKTISTAEKEALENYKKSRPRLNFTEMGIPKGAKLVFSYGEINTEVYVASDRKVKTADSEEEKYLSQVTKEILRPNVEF